MRSPTLFLGAWLLLAGVPSPGRAGDLDSTTQGDGVSVSISSPFTTLPPGGCVPFQVNIRNDRSTSATWQIRFLGFSEFSMGTTAYVRDFAVAGKTSGKFDLLVPLPTILPRGGGQSLYLYAGASGPGLSNRSGVYSQYFAFFNTAITNTFTPFTLLGKQLLGDVGTGQLESFCSGTGAAFYGSQVDVQRLPSDWRGYSGVASILLKDTEWLEMGRDQRDAVDDYVAQGGCLTIFATGNGDAGAPQLQLPTPDGKAGWYGFGSIQVIAATSILPDAKTLYTALTSHHASSASDVDGDFSSWAMRAWAGTIAISAVFILAFILIFGSLVGPVNLFVFARGKRRFRLFWTTPLISVGASIVLILGIFLTDGLGGKGKQMVAFFSLPGANRQAIIQEQIVRTAVLFSNHWNNTQDYLMTPVSDQALSGSMDHTDSYTYRSTLDAQSNASDSYIQNGNVLSGNWFRSRSISGQYLQAMVPSRSVLTVLNPAPPGAGQEAPVLLSSFPEDLSVVYLIDGAGKCWTCQDLAPGQKKVCASCAQSDYDRFWSNLYNKAGGKLRPALRRAGGHPGCFYAIGQPMPGETLATLPEIRWDVDDGIYLGPWVASNVPENAP